MINFINILILAKIILISSFLVAKESSIKETIDSPNNTIPHDKTLSKEIIINGNDAMQFDVKSYEVAIGQPVRLTFKNVGSMPKIAMGHNLVILKEGIDGLAFGQKVLASGGSASNPYLPPYWGMLLHTLNFSALEKAKPLTLVLLISQVNMSIFVLSRDILP